MTNKIFAVALAGLFVTTPIAFAQTAQLPIPGSDESVRSADNATLLGIASDPASARVAFKVGAAAKTLVPGDTTEIRGRNAAILQRLASRAGARVDPVAVSPDALTLVPGDEADIRAADHAAVDAVSAGRDAR